MYTAFLAILFALLKAWPAAFVMILLSIHLGIFALPIAIVFVAILSGRQVGNQLDVKGNPFVWAVTLGWLFCLVTVFVFWSIVFISVSIVAT